MKAIYFIFTTSLFAQDLEYLKSQDTLYLLVPKQDSLRLNNFTYKAMSNSVVNDYYFTQKYPKYIFIETINDKETDSVKRNLTVIRKRFFKKYKKNITDVNFIDRIGLSSFFMGVVRGEDKNKVLYIINSRELSDKEIVLKRAYIVDSSFISM